MILLVAIISGPEVSSQIEKIVREKDLEVVFNKVDLEIDLLSEVEKLKSLEIKLLILDLFCIDDIKRVPLAIRNLKNIKNDIRIILVAPFSFSGNKVLAELISMQIYDIIGHSDGRISDLLKNNIDKPATLAQGVGWDISVKSANDEDKVAGSTVQNTQQQRKVFGKVVIAVAGTLPRIGTTHLVLSIARYFLQNKCPVAIVELNQNNSFEAIKSSYQNVTERNDMFSLAGIDFYPFNPDFSVSDLLQENYKYIILDMGVYSKCNKYEFTRAQERIIVSGVKDWEFEPLETILRNENKLEKNKYYFNFSNDVMFDIVKYSMGNLDCFKAPFNPQPLDESQEIDRVIESMLEEVIPESFINGDTEDKSKLSDFLGKVDKVIHDPILVHKINGEYEEQNEQSGFADFMSKYGVLVKGITKIIIISIILTFVYLFLDKAGILEAIKRMFNQ